MADFDLSLVASFDTQQAEAGAARVEGSIDGMAAAEKRATGATQAGTRAAGEAARAERERAASLDAVRSAIEPNYAAQKRMNDLLAQATRLQREGAISLAQLEAVQKLHSAALKGGAASAGAARSAYTQLGFQVQDITQSLALGVNPMVVFGQQAGQTAAAVAGMGGKIGAVGKFIAGPYGSLVLGAVTVLGMFAFSHKKAGDDADKLKKTVRELADVLLDEKAAIGEVRDALDEYNKQQKKAQQNDLDSIATRARGIASRLQEAAATREQLAAELAFFEAQSRRGAQSEANDRTRDSEIRLADNIRDKIKANDVDIARLRTASGNVVIEAADKIAGLGSDAESNIREGFRVLRDEAKKAGGSVDALAKKLTDLNKQERAAIKALESHHRASSTANNQVGREINSTEAQAIAKGAGFRVTDADRTIAEQKRLYDTVRTKANPVAFPDANAPHVRGNALDIAFGAGVTPAALKAAYAKEGVTLTKVLRETGHFHIEWKTTGADKVEREAEQLAAFGDKARESIARITEQFDEQPRLIDQATRSVRELDATIADLAERKPPGFEKLIADAQAAKGVIADSLLKPFDDIIAASEKRMQIDRLVAAGREDEANALQIIWQLEEKLGPIGEARKQQILDTVTAEHALSDELAVQKELQDALLGVTQQVRSQIEGILSGTGKLNLGGLFKQLKGKFLTEQIFGGALRDLDKYVKENTGIRSSVDLLTGETERAGASAGTFADALDDVVARIRSGAIMGGSSSDTATGTAGGWSSFLGQFDSSLGKGGAGPAPASSTPGTASSENEIVVTAIKSGVNGLSPERYFEEMTRRLTKPLLDSLDHLFGTQFFGRLNGVVSGAANGFATGGIPGGILGALKGIKGLPDSISAGLGKALKGSQTGTMVAGVGNALGLKLSTTGAQLGGAVGSFLPIPGGQIIGSIAGGLLGKLFGGGSKYGTSRVGSGGAAAGNNGAMSGAAGDAATAVEAGLSNIAKALNAQLGSYAVSIGTIDGKYRVSTTGRTGKLENKYGDVKDFGTDGQAAAIAFAIANAIADGAIAGISPAVAKALRSSGDIEQATAEAIKVADLESSLKYMGDETRKAFDDFAATAKARVDLAQKYGVDLVKVEELNAKERAQLVEDSLARSTGSLKRLLDDLNSGNLFEGTAAERRAKLLQQIDAAKADSAAGKTGANDTLADLERQLVETSRAAFGTAGSEYAADRNQAMTTAQGIIAAEQKRIEDAVAATAQQITLANETNDLLSGVNGRLDTLIDRISGGEAGPAAIPTGWQTFGTERLNVVPY